MSYGVSAALQRAVYERLTADPAVSAAAPGAVFDAPPEGPLPETYVSLGPEQVRDRSDKTGRGATHDFTVSVISAGGGFEATKTLAGAVSDALLGAELALARGRLVAMEFLQATAGRTARGRLRRIDLRFRARVDDDQL